MVQKAPPHLNCAVKEVGLGPESRVPSIPDLKACLLPPPDRVGASKPRDMAAEGLVFGRFFTDMSSPLVRFLSSKAVSSSEVLIL